MKPGDKYVVHVGFDRLDEAVEMNSKAGAHLWTLIVQYGLTDQEAAHASEGVQVVMDRDHLLATFPIGCYICEQLYEDCAGKPCPGNPPGELRRVL